MNDTMDFQTVCPCPKRIYIIPSYLVVLEQQNYSSQCSSCVFFRKIEEKLFWVIEAINEASATNSIMILITRCMSMLMQKHFVLFSLILRMFKTSVSPGLKEE